MAWRGSDERVRVGVVKGGRWRWRLELGKVGLPALHADSSGTGIAVSDLLGEGAWLVSNDGRVAWQAPKAPAAATVGANGRVALAVGTDVEVRTLGGKCLWQAALPGRAHALQLGGSVLAVLGSRDLSSVLPDQLWLYRTRL